MTSFKKEKIGREARENVWTLFLRKMPDGLVCPVAVYNFFIKSYIEGEKQNTFHDESEGVVDPKPSLHERHSRPI
jgi:hypothetical protein